MTRSSNKKQVRNILSIIIVRARIPCNSVTRALTTGQTRCRCDDNVRLSLSLPPFLWLIPLINPVLPLCQLEIVDSSWPSLISSPPAVTPLLLVCFCIHLDGNRGARDILLRPITKFVSWTRSRNRVLNDFPPLPSTGYSSLLSAIS